MNHESSSYLQEVDKKHTVLSQNQQQPKQLDSAVQQKQEECRNKTSTTVPPTSEYKTNENVSVPSASKEQIRATPNHHHDTSTLQNNKKNATKKIPSCLVHCLCRSQKSHAPPRTLLGRNASIGTNRPSPFMELYPQQSFYSQKFTIFMTHRT
jgi:hypothetical protein